MKKIFFLDDFDSSQPWGESLIIALDPAVSYQLEKRKLPYKILEDYYDEKDLRAGESAYFYDQLKWFDLFDRFLEKHIGICGDYKIPMAKANYARMKYCVDTILLNLFVLDRFFDKIRGQGITEIVYFHRTSPPDSLFSIFNLMARNRWIFGEILRFYAEKNSIPFSHSILATKDTGTSRSSWKPRFPLLKKHLKKVTHIFKFEKTFYLFETARQKLFFLHAGGPDVDLAIKDTLRHGATVYLKEHDKIIVESSWSRRELPLPPPEESAAAKIVEDCNRAASLLGQDPEILPWINRRYGVDISGIAEPFLRQFVSEEVPKMLQSALQMRDFFRLNNIDYVFARGNTDLPSMGALIAAKYMKTAPCVCLGHASFALDHELVGVFDTETYSFNFARDPVSESFLKESLSRRYPTDCKIFRSMHYLQEIKKKSARRKIRKPPETIVYVETRFADRVRCFNNMSYPITWYYEFQKAVADSFATQKKFKLIYKHADSPNQAWAKNSILKYLLEKQADHITVHEEDFPKSLHFADRVIMDYPSGALFEAAVAGKPILCFYADYLRILPKAKEIFGECFQPFRTTAEALKILHRFLEADPKIYTVDFPLDRRGFFENFSQIFQPSSKARPSVSEIG